MSIQYHLEELKIAEDPKDPRNVLPEVRPADRTVVDIGCGVGQTLLALGCPDRHLIGVDVDASAIEYARENFPELEVYVAEAQALPLADKSADLAILRVSLPYMNIPKVVAEVYRILRHGGRVWMTLHSQEMAKRFLAAAIRKRDVKDALHKTYVIANGFLFKSTGRLVPFVNGRYESWQDMVALTKLLEAQGLDVEIGRMNERTFVEATKPAVAEAKVTPHMRQGLGRPSNQRAV